MNYLARLIIVPVFACAAAGCSANPEDAAWEDTEQSQAALTGCTLSQYNLALGHYKNAVAGARDRIASGACATDDSTLWSIADEASRAVRTCDTFRATIRTSTWAAPLRQVLSPSLTLRSLTGELLVVSNAAPKSWSGTDTFFSRGLTFWAEAEGVYGPKLRIDFRASGQASWSELQIDPTTGASGWRKISASYRITKTSESGPRTLTVVRDGKAVNFSLGVQDPLVDAKAAPNFLLAPLGVSPPLGSGDPVPALYSLVSECDA